MDEPAITLPQIIDSDDETYRPLSKDEQHSIRLALTSPARNHYDTGERAYLTATLMLGHTNLPAAPGPLAPTDYSGTYRGRTIHLMTAGDDSRYVRAVVNGSPQFSFRADTPPAFALAEIRRYIDAVDADAERARQMTDAGAYVHTNRRDFADTWRAGA